MMAESVVVCCRPSSCQYHVWYQKWLILKSQLSVVLVLVCLIVQLQFAIAINHRLIKINRYIYQIMSSPSINWWHLFRFFLLHYLYFTYFIHKLFLFIYWFSIIFLYQKPKLISSMIHHHHHHPHHHHVAGWRKDRYLWPDTNVEPSPSCLFL